MKNRINVGPKKLLHYKRQTRKDTKGYRKTNFSSKIQQTQEKDVQNIFYSFNKTGKNIDPA